MRRGPLVLLLLLAACSSGSRTTSLGSPGPQPPTTPATTPAPSSPAAQPSPTPSPTPSPSLSPAPRRTVAAVSSPVPARTTAPSPSPSPAPKRSATTFGVDEVTGDRFSPSALTLHAGDEVLVTDRDPLAPHNFTVRALGVRSGDMAQGDTFRYRFTAPGSYTFVCTIHEGAGMTGTLTVTR